MRLTSPTPVPASRRERVRLNGGQGTDNEREREGVRTRPRHDALDVPLRHRPLVPLPSLLSPRDAPLLLARPVPDRPSIHPLRPAERPARLVPAHAAHRLCPARTDEELLLRVRERRFVGDAEGRAGDDAGEDAGGEGGRDGGGGGEAACAEDEGRRRRVWDVG